jgi:hypothetical protein
VSDNLKPSAALFGRHGAALFVRRLHQVQPLNDREIEQVQRILGLDNPLDDEDDDLNESDFELTLDDDEDD